MRKKRASCNVRVDPTDTRRVQSVLFDEREHLVFCQLRSNGKLEKTRDDGVAARNIGREESARLAAILPAPLKRKPERMNHYSGLILERMSQMGW